MICQTIDPGTRQDAYLNDMNMLVDKWNNNPNIRKTLGEAGYAGEEGQLLFESVFFKATGMLPSENMPKRWGAAYRKRVEKELEMVSRQIRDPRHNMFMTMIGTTASNLEATPQTKQYMRDIQQVANYEAVQMNKMDATMTTLSKDLIAAMAQDGVSKKEANAIIEKIQTLERQIQVGIMNNDPKGIQQANDYKNELAALHRKAGGRINAQFVAMMDQLSIDDLNAYAKTGQVSLMVNGREEIVKNDRLVSAVRSAKGLLHDMGNNMIHGLAGMEKLVKKVYAGGRYKDTDTRDILADSSADKSLKRKLERLVEAEQNLRQSMDEGRYYPHYLIQANAKIMKGIVDLGTKYRDHQWKEVDSDRFIESSADKVFEGLDEFLPTLAKARGVVPDPGYAVNALGVIQQYGTDTIHFNKLVHSQMALVDVFRRMPTGPDAGRAWQGIREYIMDNFNLHMEGYSGRGKTINTMVRSVTALEFVSKMGFSIPTAVRNLAGAQFWMNHFGYREYFRMNDVLKDRDVSEGLAYVKKNFAGFQFGVDISQISQGALSSVTGIRTAPIETDAEGRYTLEEQTELAKTSASVADMIIRVAGKPQEVTENFIRNQIFDRTFAKVYSEFLKQPSYKVLRDQAQAEGSSAEQRKEWDKAQKELARRSANFALGAVNDWAFDYSPTGKAKIAGGTTSKMGAVGQVIMQYMHYTMEMTYRQANVLSAGGRSVKSAYQSIFEPDGSLTQAAAFLLKDSDFRGALVTAAVGTLMGYFTAMTGYNFSGLFENATVEKAQDLYNFVTADEEEKKNVNYGGGFVSLFTGPFLADVIKIGQASNLVEMPEDGAVAFMLGYNQLTEGTEDERMEMVLRTMQPHVMNMVTSDVPKALNGNLGSVLMRNVGLRPTMETKQIHEEFKTTPSLLRDVLNMLGQEPPQPQRYDRRPMGQPGGTQTRQVGVRTPRARTPGARTVE